MTEATTRAPGSRKEDWITLQFRRVYDDALHADVPPEMLRLLNELDDRDEAQSVDNDQSNVDPDEDGTA
jgi:hypothetical protein